MFQRDRHVMCWSMGRLADSHGMDRLSDSHGKMLFLHYCGKYLRETNQERVYLGLEFQWDQATITCSHTYR